MKNKRQKFRFGRFFLIAIICVFLVGIGLTGWVFFGNWPNPVRGELAWKPDVILVLGGSDLDRPGEAMKIAEKFPNSPVIVTGDGGLIYDKLLEAGMPKGRLIHETRATSTVENAQYSRSILDELGAQRIVIVTDWFHVPRARTIFEKVQPEREFFLSFPNKPEELDSWHAYCAKRERVVAIHNLVWHGVWPF